MVRIIGAPFDLCGRAGGSSLGPAAMRLAGLREAIEAIGLPVEDTGDVPVPLHPTDQDGFRGYATFLKVALQLKEAVLKATTNGAMPLIIGGDHSLAAGSLAGALAAHGRDLAVLWIDAHADLNTPDTSPTGNLHGMPLGLLMGLPADKPGQRGAQWRQLQRKLLGGPVLLPDRISWLGLRDVDPGEAQLLTHFPASFAATMHQIDREGIAGTVRRFDGWLRASGATQLWVSFDVDCLDPVLAPGTGTAVRGGLTYREAHLIAELLRERLDCEACPYKLAGMDVVETNPILDSRNITAVTAVEWVASLLGKTILGKR